MSTCTYIHVYDYVHCTLNKLMSIISYSFITVGLVHPVSSDGTDDYEMKPQRLV